MSGGGSSGGSSSRWPQFTAAQWQELEHQALIFKYLKAGLSVPPDLLAPIHRSLESISARYLQYPTSGYYSVYGKKIDPEPGRCPRTDGKKWRCSKDSHPESKYCERHMNRGRHRSRKPVESQTASSQSLPPPALNVGIGSSSSGGSRIFQNLPSSSNSVNLSFGSHSSQLQGAETTPYGSCNNKYSEPKPQAETNKSVVQASVGVRGLDLGNGVPLHGIGIGIGVGGYSSSLQKQHYFFGSSSPAGTENLEQPFFETLAFLDSQRSDMNSFSSTQLSMGIDKDPSKWLERDSGSPNDVEGNMRNFQA